MSQVKKESNLLDFTGVFLSILCAIHCTLGPLLILFLPALGGIFGSELFHLGVFFAIVPIAGMTFIRCYKKHKSKETLILAMIAIALLLTGLVTEHTHALMDLIGANGGHHHHHHDHAHGLLEHGFTLAGSFCIVIAHIMNIKHCHCLKHPGEGTCSH
jgi:hypothetical protein